MRCVRERNRECRSMASVRTVRQKVEHKRTFCSWTVDFETFDGGERDWGEISARRVGFYYASKSRIKNGRFHRFGVTYSE